MFVHYLGTDFLLVYRYDEIMISVMRMYREFSLFD